ncbi:DUF1531-domain-containing protein [Xylariaceae sp. FL1019]|nr:DUF1531-domain-containing protein [Xylariaceae sp. FL1019]
MADELTDLIYHLVDSCIQLYNLLKERVVTNVGGTLGQMTKYTPQQWIRIIAIVGAYILFRPYVLKHAAKYQEKQMKKQSEDQAEISPNQLRGEQTYIPDDTDDEEEADVGQTSASDWGKKARRRQRQVLKKLIDDQEKRLQETVEEEEDKDIAEFLTG